MVLRLVLIINASFWQRLAQSLEASRADKQAALDGARAEKQVGGEAACAIIMLL
jgi:hypothetical protein